MKTVPTNLSFQEKFKAALAAILPDTLETSHRYGVAVSGGADSMALMHTLLEHLDPQNLVILHFEHNPENPKKEMTALVKETFEPLGVQVLEGEREEALEGNLEQAWREARYSFLKKAYEDLNLTGLFLGHTENDLAETVLMRLAKGSGLTGLIPMTPAVTRRGMLLLRPLLSFKRQEIEGYLQTQSYTWLEDPSNQDDTFQRVRLRKLQQVLEEAGITSQGIAASVHSLSRADTALEAYTQQFIARWCSHKEEGLLIDATLFEIQPEIALRVIKWAILTVNPAPMAPRSSKRQRLLDTLKNAQGMSLGGVRFTPQADAILLTKEDAEKA